MKLLSYNTLKEISYDGFLLPEAPERILQFGEGNFLRAFVDYFVDVLNEKTDFHSKVVVCQPTARNTELAEKFAKQDGLYTLYLRGFQNGETVNQKRVISCISRCLNAYRDFEELLHCAENPELRYIVCNTTEAGIVYDPTCQLADAPASSYPGKLTQFLYRRYQKFDGDMGKGFVVLPCELIDDNGRKLERCVLQYADQWQLGEDFIHWIQKANVFCSTLVDRIVTGYPKNEMDAITAENGYIDHLVDTGEIFGFWVMEGPPSLKEELPFEKAGLPVLVTDHYKPYQQRKVRILNGAHTSFVLGAYLAGKNMVGECMDDPVIRKFIEQTIYQEILPTLDLPKKEEEEFAHAVIERFQNPFIHHALLSIALNSTSKWKSRVLPSLKGYVQKTGQIPPCISASFAFYIAFYRGHAFQNHTLIGYRNGEEYPIKDDHCVLQFYYDHQNENTETLVHAVSSNTSFWGEDLSLIPGLETAVIKYLKDLEEKGAYEVMRECIK